MTNLISKLKTIFAGLPDKRRSIDVTYTMADIGLSAFSVLFMQSPSFLAHQRRLEAGNGRSNCHTLFGMSGIPCDNHIRQMLDGAPPAAFDGLFVDTIKEVVSAGGLSDFLRLNGRVLIALDGTECFNSRKISCPSCSTRRRSDGGVECFHSFLGASLVAPGHSRVMPLPPEFIVAQDGAEKQDCERAAAKRWLAKHGPVFAQYRPVYLGDDLFACQPIASEIQASGGNFILTCKPSSHKTISEYIDGAEIETHSNTIRKRGKRTTYVYKWINEIPIRDTKDALIINWFSVEIINDKNKRAYYNSYITDIVVNVDVVAELAECARARWKIENETFNVLKTGGYNLEHNFGHGKKTLANILVVLNLLAFSFHTAAYLADLAWRRAITVCGARYCFFEQLRAITIYIVFPDWQTLLNTMADPKSRPP